MNFARTYARLLSLFVYAGIDPVLMVAAAAMTGQKVTIGIGISIEEDQ